MAALPSFSGALKVKTVIIELWEVLMVTLLHEKVQVFYSKPKYE